MKAEQLRIGNLYEAYNGKSEAVDLQFFVNLWNDVDADEMIKSPITLTEEWLIKFGFKSNNQTDGFWFPQTNIWVRSQKGRFTAHLQHDKLIDIKYVHQLQNLYYALTGEELTIEETA